MKIRTFLLSLAAIATLHISAADWIDVTSKYIKNPSFDGNDISTGWQGTAFGAASPMENAEHYNKYYDTWQRIDNPMKGRYRLSLNAFYRMGTSSNDWNLYQSGEYADYQHAKLYVQQSGVNIGETPIAPASSGALEESLGGETSTVGSWYPGGGRYYIPNNMYAAYLWFQAGYYHNELEFTIEDSSLPLFIGIYKNTTIKDDWTCLDNWKLEWWGDMVYVTSVKLDKTTANMVVGERLQLTATVLPANAINGNLQWTSNNESVASVTADGMVIANGSGKVTITATSVDGSNKSASCTITVTNNDATTGSLVINEIQPANIDQIVDPSWNYGGWVELYNPGSTGVSLKGCWLSDDAGNLKKAHITQPMAVPAKGYLNLWFDHHDKYCETQVNMKLDAEGGTIFLSDKNGKLIAKQAYPAAFSRCSYARKALSGDEWGWSSTPTPEYANDGMKYATKQMGAPVVDQPTQVFNASLQVCVNIPQGATLRFTTDGRTPTEYSDASATGLFTVTETTRYRFRLFADGMLPSPVTTRTYILNDKDFSLPVISVVGSSYDLYSDDMGIFVRGNGNGRPGNGQSSPCNWNMDWERAVNFEYIDNGQMAVNQEVFIERCGGWSRAWTPYSFKLKANKQLEGQKTLPYQFFSDKPYLKHKTLQIRNGGNDNTCRIKDPALQQIIARSGLNVDYQAYQPVMHYLNGLYAGVINMREPNNKHYVYANYGLDDDEIDQFEMSPDSGYVQKCGTYESMQRWKDLAAACGENDEAYEEIRKMVDIDEYCNYMAVEFYLGSDDWPQNNVKGWKPIMEGGKFRFVLFDLDHSFNTSASFATFAGKQTYTFDKLYGEPVQNITKEIEFVTIFLDMLENDNFRKQFIDTYCLVTGSVFEPTRCNEIISELANRVATPQDIYTEFYGKGSSPWGTANSLIGSLSSDRQTTMMNVLKNYGPMQLSEATPQRVSLSTNLPEARLTVNGLPVPTNKFSGQLYAPVTFNTEAPAGYKFMGWKMLEGSNLERKTILTEESQWKYYDQGSLDGTNWQSADYNDSNWSEGKAPLGYFVGGDRYTNTYIEYGGDNSNKYPTYYFRKTINLDGEPSQDDIINLNYTIDDGLIIYVNGTEAGRYNMPSGDVSFNTMATSYAHGNPDQGSLTLPTSLFHSGSNTIAVEVHNNAANSTDAYWESNITLSTPKGDYASTEQAMEMPEGDMTLVAVYEEMSAEERAEAGLSSAPVVINEVSAGNSIYVNEYGKKDDWIELYNTTDKDIDLEGMFLTDRSNKPEKDTISAIGTKASTIIPAHGYKVIWCSKRNTDNQLHVNFKLDNKDSIVVRIMAKDKSWADSLVYCAHNGDQTFGRYPDGGTQTYLMHLPTIEKSNTIDTYASVWEYVPEGNPGTSIRSLASRSAGMSIAYASDQLLIKSEDSQDVAVSVYTPSGALVMRQSIELIETTHGRVSVASLPAGIYVARATDADDNECAVKFVKK